MIFFCPNDCIVLSLINIKHDELQEKLTSFFVPKESNKDLSKNSKDLTFDDDNNSGNKGVVLEVACSEAAACLEGSLDRLSCSRDTRIVSWQDTSFDSLMPFYALRAYQDTSCDG